MVALLTQLPAVNVEVISVNDTRNAVYVEHGEVVRRPADPVGPGDPFLVVTYDPIPLQGEEIRFFWWDL